MVRDLVRGILVDYQGKPLTKKRLEEITLRITTAVSMLKASEPIEKLKDAVSTQKVEVSTKEEPSIEVQSNSETKAETVVSKGGNKICVSKPPDNPKPKKKPSYTVAMPIGTMGEGVIDGKRVSDDVGAFTVKK